MVLSAIVFAFVIGNVVASPLPEGDTDVDWRIVGGSAASEGQYPYQVSLRTRQNSHFCGGSIINPNWILTAAHCVYGQYASNIIIVVGTNYLNSGGTSYGVSQIIWHQGFSQQNNVNDIAVLRVASSISHNPRVQPIDLASSPPPSGAACILSGWGLTSYPSNSLPNNLQHILLTAISTAQCQQGLAGHPVSSSNVCTYQGVGQGACHGDSGGPLVSGGVQHGIVSWGIPCAKGDPDVFTSVAYYRNWIRSTTGV